MHACIITFPTSTGLTDAHLRNFSLYFTSCYPQQQCWNNLQMTQLNMMNVIMRSNSTFMMPFQLSPVETWNSVRKAIPKFSKVAWRLIPSQGQSALHTEKKHHEERTKWSKKGKKSESKVMLYATISQFCVFLFVCPQSKTSEMMQVVQMKITGTFLVTCQMKRQVQSNYVPTFLLQWVLLYFFFTMILL